MRTADRLYDLVAPLNHRLATWLTQRLGAAEWAGTVLGLAAIAELAVLAA